MAHAAEAVVAVLLLFWRLLLMHHCRGAVSVSSAWAASMLPPSVQQALTFGNWHLHLCFPSLALLWLLHRLLLLTILPLQLLL